MIHEFLQRQVAWRFGSTDFARRRFLTMASLRRAREASADGRCAHCHRTLDDPTFKTCTPVAVAVEIHSGQRRNGATLLASAPAARVDWTATA